MSSAYVTSLAALSDFRAALTTFIDEAKNAVTTLELEIRRSLDWLEGQLGHWKAAVREAEDDVIRAQNELARKRLMRIGDRPPDTTDQEKALARAKHRLELAQEKLARTKHWLWALPDEIREYQGPCRLFQEMVEGDLPMVATMLERKIVALEAYIEKK